MPKLSVYGAVAAIFGTLACLSASGGANETPSFDPARGFRPAQRDLTQIYLQIADSLEFYGSPVPYLRHVAAEDKRVRTLYRQQFGNECQPFLPDYMTAQYIDRLSANWNLLSPKLGLDTYAKDVGRMIRNAITSSTGTILIDIFNQHQARVFDRMVGKGNAPSDFDALKTHLVSQLELDKDGVDAEHVEAARPDAITSAQDIHQETVKLFNALDQGLAPAAAEKVKTVLTSIILDVGRMAQSELEVGIVDQALREQSTLAVPPIQQPYSADQETALNADERKEYAALLSKPHFTKADFALLDAFYSGPYERLSERGKDELSYRVWGGVRSQASN